MDEESRRHYDTLNSDLDHYFPDDARTPDQIGYVAVNYWRAGREHLEQQRDGAQDYAKATVIEPDEQTRIVAKINYHYEQKIDIFEMHFNTAVKEIYRENGISFEEPNLSQHPDDPQEKQVKLYSEQQHKTDQHMGEQTNRDGGQRGEFITKVEQLPAERVSSPEPPNRPTSPSHLTPKLQIPAPGMPFLQAHTPPRDQGTTRDADTSPIAPREITPSEITPREIPERSARDIPGRVVRDDVER